MCIGINCIFCQDLYHNKGARDQDPLIGRGQLEGSPLPLRHKTKTKRQVEGNFARHTYTKEDTNKKLTIEDCNRPNIIEAKQTELESF